MAVKTKGSEAMREALAEQRGKAAALARHMSVAPSTVVQWSRGHMAPKTKARIRIKKFMGIPIEAWDEELTNV